MLALKYENLLNKTNEDILEKEILEISGLNYFNKSEKYLTLNDSTYCIQSLTIKDIIDLIIANGGIVSIKNNDYLNYPSFILGNYSSYLLYEQEDSPVNLNQIMYRYSDIEYTFRILNKDNFTNINGLLSSKDNKTVLKIVSKFLLFKIHDNYIGS